jgi:hypothetical protein
MVNLTMIDIRYLWCKLAKKVETSIHISPSHFAVSGEKLTNAQQTRSPHERIWITYYEVSGIGRL